MNPPLIVDFLASKGIPMMGGYKLAWTCVVECFRESERAGLKRGATKQQLTIATQSTVAPSQLVVSRSFNRKL